MKCWPSWTRSSTTKRRNESLTRNVRATKERKGNELTVNVAVYGEHNVERVAQIQLVSSRLNGKTVHRVYDLRSLMNLGEMLDATFVPLEIDAEAIPLSEFQHPENALYVLGPQHSFLPDSALDLMPTPVYVETFPDAPSPVLPTPVVLGVVLHHRLMQTQAVAA